MTEYNNTERNFKHKNMEVARVMGYLGFLMLYIDLLMFQCIFHFNNEWMNPNIKFRGFYSFSFHCAFSVQKFTP